MSPRIRLRVARNAGIALGCLFALLACDVGQGIKTLGKKAVGGTGTGATDADSFSINIAYRDSASDSATPIRTVSLQGIRGVPSASLVNECGTSATTCTCEFYVGSSDTTAKMASSVGISSQNNSFTCVVPTSITDAQLKASTGTTATTRLYVKLKRTDVTGRNTGLMEVKSSLTLEDVLGSSLSQNKVRGIFRYDCTRTFFEGEGVSASEVQCIAAQKLGVLGATYNFYVYRSKEDRNETGGDSGFSGAICQRNSFLKLRCTGNTPSLSYGLYKESVEPFVVGITMTRAPEGENLTAVYGYAALPDSSGNCPTGLVKVRPYQAQPTSIVQDSLGDGNPPSNFINTANTLNNTVVEATAPSNFVVTRQKNLTPCDSTGSCVNATFAGQSTAQSVAYTALTPIVCAIPKDLLSGLF